MMEEEDAEVDILVGVDVTGTGNGAARLVGLAKERKTALAFCFPVEDDAVGPAEAEEEVEGAAVS